LKQKKNIVIAPRSMPVRREVDEVRADARHLAQEDADDLRALRHLHAAELLERHRVADVVHQRLHIVEAVGVHEDLRSRATRRSSPLPAVQPLMNNIGYAMALEQTRRREGAGARADHPRPLVRDVAHRLAPHLPRDDRIDLGAITMFFFCFKERENPLHAPRCLHRSPHEQHVRADRRRVRRRRRARAGEIEKWIDAFPRAVDEFEQMLTGNRIWYDRN